MFCSPDPPLGTAPLKPRPSSLTSNRSQPSALPMLMFTWRAESCFVTFWSVSAQQLWTDNLLAKRRSAT
jgi:hypothetical protein